MDNQPLITIGFTCFNAADTIARAVKTAQTQTWDNLDILIVDDGSQDRSVQVIEGLKEADKRIRLIVHPENQGTAVARNTIAQNAKGEFLAFMDDDDESLPGRVEKQYRRLVAYENEHNAEIVFCYCDRDVVLEGEDRVDHQGYGIGRQAPEPRGRVVADFLLWNFNARNPVNARMGQIGSGTMMMRSAAFKKIGYFDPEFRRSAEVDLAVRAALAGGHFISVPEPLIVQHKTHTGDKGGRKPLDYALLLCRKNKTYLSSQGLYWAAQAMNYARFYSNRGEKLKSRLCVLLACLTAPHKILPHHIFSR